MEGRKRARVLERIAKIIVDRRNLLFLFYIIAIIFSIFSMRWVNVENDIIYYLSEDSKTRQGITVMNEEFTTLGMADIMISNISYGHARDVADKIGDVHGVASVMFDNTEDYYKKSSALFVVLLSGEDTDEISLKAMEEIRDIVSPYDVFHFYYSRCKCSHSIGKRHDNSRHTCILL